MGQYKGLDIADDLVPIVRHMEHVDSTRSALQDLQGIWDTLALLGDLSDTGVAIGSLRAAFADLSAPLLGELAHQTRHKTLQQLRTKAQVAIDILVRNLFERTADIGFLATDDDLVAYARVQDAAGRDLARGEVLTRFEAYRAKYTVYDDIVLADAQGALLARLRPGPATATGDALLHEALTTDAAYVETFAPSDLRPGEGRRLVYSCALGSAAGRMPVVLSLHFRFEDECARIFEALRDTSWTVLTLVDVDGVVIATSDPTQIPVGAPLLGRGRAPGPKGTIRFAGSLWLEVTCAARPYQGYAGPAWRAVALIPVVHAFEAPVDGDDAAAASSAIPPELMHSLVSSDTLFAGRLRDIPLAAENIEIGLNRAVWNGSVAGANLRSAAVTQNSVFSKALLREITSTGARTRATFTQATSEMNRTVVSSTLADLDARAALAIDIMDRNLYERANDCRWWALTTAFRAALSDAVVDPATRAKVRQTLRTIHGLYTVYGNLVVFDRNGVIVAASVDTPASAEGRTIDEEWVARTLQLPTAQDHVVSDFEPTALYGGERTYVYAAAVRTLDGRETPVGGVAIVFDSGPQFEAILRDVLPAGKPSQAGAGDCAAFLDADGRVISLVHADGSAPAAAVDRLRRLDLPKRLRSATGGRCEAAVVALEGRVYGIGMRPSSGYREYRADGGRERGAPSRAPIAVLVQDLACHVAMPAALSAGHVPIGAPADARRPGPHVELATFSIDGAWFALPAAQLREAVRIPRVMPLPASPPHIRGTTLVHGDALVLVDASQRLGGHGRSSPAGIERQMIVVAPATGRAPFALQVDALGSTIDVPVADLVDLGLTRLGLADKAVRLAKAAQGDPFLVLLSVERLADLVRPASAAQGNDAAASEPSATSTLLAALAEDARG